MGAARDVAEKEAMPQRAFLGRKWTFLDKRTAFLILFTHILAVFAPFHFTWNALWVAVVYYMVSGVLGISLSYHRHLTHKSFKLPKWLEYSFAYFGVLGLQGDPIDWVSTHRHHHRSADTENDPHSPLQGFGFSYLIWVMDSYTLTKKVNPQYSGDFKEIKTNILKGQLKHGTPTNASDLEKQMFYRIMQKTYWLHPLAFSTALYATGGVPFLTWGMGVSPTLGFHLTSTVNSVCHIWGSQPWNTGDLSKNNWLVALVTSGEGWHNNHHAFEYSAKFGLEWWQIDPTWYIIMFLEAIGLATDVKLPSEKHMLAKAHQTPKIVDEMKIN